MNTSKYISSNPRINGGRPVVDGTGISTGSISVRFAAGESVDQLIEDYELSRQQIEAAIRWELIGEK